MPETNHLVFVEPELHILDWGSCVMHEIVGAHGKPEYVIRELRNGDAVPNKINTVIDEVDPAFLWGAGHGEVCVYSCECRQLYLSIKSPSFWMCDKGRNLDKVSGRVIHLNSCLTGVELGPALIEHGAVTYYGSKECFWLYLASPPCSDRASRTVFLAEHQVEASLLEGRTTGEARGDQLRRYEEEIAYWLTGPGRTHPYASSLVRILEIDKGISVMYGSETATVCVPAVPAWWWLVQIALGVAPLAVVGGVVYTEEARKLTVT